MSTALFNSDSIDGTQSARSIDHEFYGAATSITSLLDFSVFNFLATHDLTAEQFRLFRHVMFGRVYLTIPSICQALRAAVLNQDYCTAQTCLMNLNDELTEPNHQVLMERAYNYVGERVFSLPPTTLRACFDQPILVEEVLYRATVEALYLSDPVAASMCQELSSGGTLEQAGMMGRMYQVFQAIYRRRPFESEKYSQEVLPYFCAHLTIDSSYNLVSDSAAVEFQHGARAIADFRRASTAATNPAVIEAFSRAQNLLFQALLKKLKDSCYVAS